MIKTTGKVSSTTFSRAKLIKRPEAQKDGSILLTFDVGERDLLHGVVTATPLQASTILHFQPGRFYVDGYLVNNEFRIRSMRPS